MNIAEIDLLAFSDEAKATALLLQYRWNGKPSCPDCRHRKVYVLKGAHKRFKCAACRTQFSATKGSIFEGSPIPLQKWFMAIYLLTGHKKGISSVQLSHDIGVTQKTAWFMLHRIRYALHSGTFEKSRQVTVEVDETFVGGKEKNKHTSTATKDARYAARVGRVNEKAKVFGILQRDGLVMARMVKDIKGKTLVRIIRKHVRKGSRVYSDEHTGYNSLGKKGYKHERVAHAKKEYVRGEVHINGLEGFWSLLKRGIIGIYHQVSHKHLDRYLQEFTFRFNTRKHTASERIMLVMQHINNRLTYKQLIAK